jgi:hypothetical protein
MPRRRIGTAKRVAAVALPLALVVGGVAYGVSRHGSHDDDKTLGECTTKVGGLTVVLTDRQARNATLISAISVRRGMPAHAATIGLAAALQESKLYNVRGGDRDSLGLFQQRPSQGWGTPRQILDPVHATNAFYAALERVPGYTALPVTVAAQRVQRSGYPSAYAVYEGDARALASAMTGYSPAAFWCHVAAPTGSPAPAAQRARATRAALLPAFGPTTLRVASRATLEVPVSSRQRGWAIASYVVSRASLLGVSGVAFRGRVWSAGDNAGWRRGGGAHGTAVLIR